MFRSLILKRAPIIMNYTLNNDATSKATKRPLTAPLKQFFPLIADEKKNLVIAFLAILINSSLTLAAPFLVGHTIDTYIQAKQFHGVLVFSGILLTIYLCAFVASYIQLRVMGRVGQRVLFKLRNVIFNKLQELPVAFFNQNKAGDLISRINNDTDKLNQFFSETLMRFVGNVFIMVGAGIFVLFINFKLGIAALLPAVGLFIITRLLSVWVKKQNTKNLQSTGNLSAEIQESLNNFKVIVAFNRRDYFREKFQQANQLNFVSAVKAGIANGIFTPIYDFSSNVAQIIILTYGIYLITIGDLSVGLLISFLTYMSRFYDPLRQIASLWASFQQALAGWDRISEILSLENNLAVVTTKETSIEKTNNLLEFKNVAFGYPDGKEVLSDINFTLKKGKTYALVGPTGGGKTTTASLMARLYDPTSGEILLDGRNISSWTPTERTQKIGFILQEPFLFNGTVRDNIVYGNLLYEKYSAEELARVLEESHLDEILKRFDKGLETKVTSSGDTMSLGQKQLIAFIRAVLRHPELLILDEATANIDTVTEKQLDEIIQQLPKSTTIVIIAHRLNTIENADEIFFVNGGKITKAGSLDNAVNMLLHDKRQS